LQEAARKLEILQAKKKKEEEEEKILKQKYILHTSPILCICDDKKFNNPLPAHCVLLEFRWQFCALDC